MRRLVSSRRWASLVVSSIMLSSAPVLAGDFTFNSVSDDEIDWNDPANWTPGTIPTITDDATVVGGLLRGAEVHEDQAVHSLILDSGLNVYRGSTLTVTGAITHNGGYMINSGTIYGNLVNSAYLASIGTYFGDVTNGTGGVILSDDAGGKNSWTGKVLSNEGWILNNHGTWTGNVVSNAGTIQNMNGGTWTGDVVSNTGEIDSINSTWIGDVDNGNIASFSGVLKGSVHNTASFVVVDPLRGVKDIVNDGGNLGFDDGATNDTLRARSLSGAGDLVVDFDPSTGTTDKVILSGDYSADTTVRFSVMGPAGGPSRIFRSSPWAATIAEP